MVKSLGFHIEFLFSFIPFFADEISCLLGKILYFDASTRHFPSFHGKKNAGSPEISCAPKRRIAAEAACAEGHWGAHPGIRRDDDWYPYLRNPYL